MSRLQKVFCATVHLGLFISYILFRKKPGYYNFNKSIHLLFYVILFIWLGLIDEFHKTRMCVYTAIYFWNLEKSGNKERSSNSQKINYETLNVSFKTMVSFTRWVKWHLSDKTKMYTLSTGTCTNFSYSITQLNSNTHV